MPPFGQALGWRASADRGPLVRAVQRSSRIAHILITAPVDLASEIVERMRNSSRPQPALGTAIRVVRERKGQTQEVVARRAGIALPTLSHIEAGHANPTWATVRDVADALGVSIGQLARLAEKHA